MRDTGDIDLREPALPPMRLKPVVVSKPQALPAPPPPAASDVTRVGPEPVGLEEMLRNEHPSLLDATVRGVKGIVEHPIDAGVALAETPAKGGYAVGEYVKGGHLNKGKGRAAAIGAAQTGAMLLGGPAERVGEPIAARLIGEAAAPFVTRTAVGAATGATFTPDRPAVGALLGGAAGAVSSRGVAEANRAGRYSQFEEFARQHPDWFGESTPAAVETRPSRLLGNPNRGQATARVSEAPPPENGPDYTVEQPKQPIIEQKGVFGGALEQHGKDYAEGKVGPPAPAAVEKAPPAPRFTNGADDANLSHITNGPPGIQVNHVKEDETKGIVVVSRDPQGVPQGYVTLEDLGDGRYGAHEVYVRSDARRQGLATSLYQAARDAGAKKIVTGYGGYATPEGETLGKSLLDKGVADQMIPRGSSAPFMYEPPAEETEPAKEGYDYSSTQLNLPSEAAADIKSLGARIPDEHLAEKGREESPHITVKYGLHGKPLRKVRELMADEGPVTVKMGKTSHFPASESGNGDVVKVDIDSPDLHRLNKKIASALPNTETHPKYQPHATIAYVKPGMGEKYSGNDALAGQEWVLHHLTFSGKDGKQVDIPLRGKREVKATPPVHESARLPSGRLRENLETVKTDGLIHEMFKLLGAEDQRDQQSAIYRTVEADVSGTQYGQSIQVATRHGNGPSEQAKALHRIELKKGVAKRMEAVLNARGLTDDDITRRYAELTESEAESAAEREGLEADRGDTGFDFGERGGNNESDVSAAHRPATERANAPAEGASEGSAAAARQGERGRPPESQRASAEPKRLTSHQRAVGAAIDQPQGTESQRRFIESLDRGVQITGRSRLSDTSGTASREQLQRFADKQYVRQLAQRFEKAFADISAAISKRYEFPPVEYGGFDISHEVLGQNIRRENFPLAARNLGMPEYKGATTNLIVVNPYIAIVEVGLNPRLRPSEYAAALSESMFGTIVHEIAHQYARGHDAKFAAYHTRYAAAASPIASQVLGELDMAWEVALQGGMADDVIQLQKEVWDVQQQREHKNGPARSEEGARHTRRLSVGGDATASYLRPFEGDRGLGEGNGRRRLGVRPDVRGGAAAGSETPSERAESGAARRLGEDEGRAAPAEGVTERLRYPEPSGLSQPRTAIRPAEFVRALKSFFNPESLGPEALGAGGTIKHQSAEAYRRLAISTHALKDFQKRIDKMSREDQVQLWDDAEHGRPTGDPVLDEGNRILRQATEERTKQLIAFDRLKAERTIENYVGRFWSQTAAKSGRDFLRAIMGRRPFEGPKSFTKPRDLDWFVDGLKRVDLIPATYNYVESQLAKIAEMERVISAEHTLRQEQRLGRAKPIMLGQEPPFDAQGDPWVKIDRTGEDPAFVVYLPPEVKHWEAVDTIVYGKLQKLIDSLNVMHDRSPKIGGTRLGYAEGDKFIATKFGGAEGVVIHEVGHILDARYGLGEKIDAAIGAAPKRTVLKGKRAGQQVPDYKSEGKDAAQRRKTLREELRQLANLRRETLSGVPSSKELSATDRSYLHSRPEKIANMVEAYVSTRDRFRTVAPGIFEIFDRIVGDHPELHPLRDIQPSLSREEHGASTRVSGIITGGHWYAPRDAAAVWHNHLSKGLAGNPIYDAAIAPVHAGTQMLLGFSGFHGTVIATEAAFSDLALATDNLVNKGGKASLAPMQIARAGISPIAGVSFGRKVMQEYRIPGTHPELKQVLDAMIAGGFRGRATSELWAGDRKEKLKRALRETLHAESKGRRLWGATKLPFDAIWAGVEAASGPLMSKYVPLMKTAATYNAVAVALERLPKDASIDLMHRVMGDVVKEMDYRFGQVDYDNHFINRVAKDLAQLVFLAPGWTFGTMALAGRGINDVAKIPKRAYKLAMGAKAEEGEPPPELIGRSAAYWIGAVLGTMLINSALSHWNTGERPHGKDYWFFRDGTKDAAGNWNRHAVPGYLTHDIYGWSNHPVHTFKNKFAPVLAFFARLADNKDYFGDMIYDPDATLPQKLKQSGKALLKELAPLSAQNYLEGKKRGEGGKAEIARNVFGITPARRELVRTAAQNKMADYLGRHSPETRTPDESAKGELHGEVVQAVRKGEELPQDVLDALAAGKVKRKTLFKWLSDARQPSIVSQFKRLSLDEAVHVYERGNDHEKALWADALRTKMKNAGNQ